MRVTDDQKSKFARSDRIMGDLLDDPGRFRRRIFQALPRIISDIVWLETNFISIMGSMRAINQVAPMLAAAWAVQSSLSIRESGDWVLTWISSLAQASKITDDDEDIFMTQLVSKGLRTDAGTTRTVAELLSMVAESRDADDEALNLLERYGITLRRKYKTQSWDLYIATESSEISILFKDTRWGDAYGIQVRRCPANKPGGTVPMTLKSGRKRCQKLDWEVFRDRYLVGDDGDSDIGVLPF
jgi:hypothetical protein